MTRILQILGLALAAVLAASALTATAAMAGGKLTSTGPVTLVAKETGFNGITAFGVKVECPESTFTIHKTLTTQQTEEGKTHELVANEATSATLTADLQNKCSDGGHKLTVTLNGCDFDIQIGEKSGSSYNTEAALVCPPKQSIAVEFYSFASSELGGVVCTVTIKEQGGLTGAKLTNVEAGKVAISEAYTGISMSESGSACATQSTSTASLDLNGVQEGINGMGNQTEVSISG